MSSRDTIKAITGAQGPRRDEGRHWQFSHSALTSRVTVPHPERYLPIGTEKHRKRAGVDTAGMAMRSDIAFIRKDADGDYGIEFPDFPGRVGGKDDRRGSPHGEGALAFHIAGMAEDGTPIPEPTTLPGFTPGPETECALMVLIDGPAKPATVLVNVLLPEDPVARIDGVSGNRFRFLASGARAKLGQAA